MRMRHRGLSAGCFGASLGLLLVVWALMPSAVWAQSAASPRPAPAADALQTLEGTFKQLEELLASVDQLIAHLTQTAKDHLDHADAAQRVDERGRYETLYAQVSARLAELQDQRAHVVQLIARLRAQLRGITRGD